MKTAALTPIPSASERIAAAVKPGVMRSCRGAVAERAPDVLQRENGLHLATVLLQQRRVAELPPRSRGGVGRRESLTHVVLRQQLEMRPHLVVEPGVRPTAEQPGDASSQRTKTRDHRSPRALRRRSRPMIPEICFQLSVSRASCFRPLAVMA